MSDKSSYDPQNRDRRLDRRSPEPQQQNQDTTTDESTAEKGYHVNIEQTPFDTTMDSMLLRSTEFCAFVNQMFSPFYADYEGSTYETIQGSGIPMVCLFFNHLDWSKDKNPTACERDGMQKNVQNSLLARRRQYDRRMIDGDRYTVTEDGRSGIGDFIYKKHIVSSPWFRDKNTGRDRIDWRRVTAEVADPNNRFMMQQNGRPMGSQYTKISYLDPAAIVQAIFGATDEDGGQLEYAVNIVNTLPGIGNMYNQNRTSNDWLLCINRAHTESVMKYASMYNVPMQNGLNINRNGLH